MNFFFCTMSVNIKSVFPCLLERDVRQISKDIDFKGHHLNHQLGPLMVFSPSLLLGESLRQPVLPSPPGVGGSQEKTDFWGGKKKKKKDNMPHTICSTKEHPEAAELKRSPGSIIGSCSPMSSPGTET